MEKTEKKSDVKWIVIVILALGLVAVYLLYKEGFLGGKDDRPSVLLITLDGVRLDRLGCAGNDAGATPNIDALARSGALFDQCTTSAPLALPAAASLLTATDPYVHGLRYNPIPPIPLGEGHITLAEILSDEGYPTAARVTSPFAYQEYGLDQGIWPSNFIAPESQNAAAPRGGQRGGPRGPGQRQPKRQFLPNEVADSTITWLRANGDKPYFFWAHITDCAAPPAAPEPHGSAYPTDPYMGDLAWVDEQVGRIIAEVEHLGKRENTLIILASTFGEGMRDGIEPLHSWFVYDCTTRVPLIFSWPGRITPAQTRSCQARLIDAAPTILDILGFDAKADAQGTSLLPVLDGTADDLALAAYTEAIAPFAELNYFPLRSLRKGGWKYVHAPKPELYNLTKDPMEKTDLAESEAARVEAMREELLTLVVGTPTLPEPDGDATVATPEGGLDEVELLRLDAPDPKEKGEVILNYTWARMEMLSGNAAGAIPPLRKVVELDPAQIMPMKMLIQLMMKEGQIDDAVTYMETFLETWPERHDLRYQLASAYDKQGALDKAIAQIEEIEKRTTDDETAQNELNGRLLMLHHRNGNFEEAERRLRIAMEDLPQNADLRFMLLRIFTDAGRLDDAADEFVRARLEAMEGSSDEPVPPREEIHYALAMTLASKGFREGALAHLRKAEEIKPDGGLIQIALGKIYGEAKDFEKSLEHFRKAKELLPDEHNVAMNLALVLKRTENYADAIKTLDENLAAKPNAVDALCLLSLILATCPDDALRDGKRALELAGKACEITKNQEPLALQSLAAASAETGLFDQARETAGLAVQIAARQGNKALALSIRKVLLECYRNDKPYREGLAAEEETPGGETTPDDEATGEEPAPEPEEEPVPAPEKK